MEKRIKSVIFQLQRELKLLAIAGNLEHIRYIKSAIAQLNLYLQKKGNKP